MLKKTFKGGVHPEEYKEITVDKKIKTIPAPSKVVIPLSQHIGKPNEPLIKVGDEVSLGQVIAESKAFVSAPVHSSVSGKVVSISSLLNPVYGKQPAAVIENNGENESVPFEKHDEPYMLSKEEMIELVKKAGIVGMGGAAFPTHVKLNVPKDKKIDTLIINGAECEPYLTCDHRLMTERTTEIIKGIYLVAKMLEVKDVFLAIEENKLSAVFSMEKMIQKIYKQFSHAKINIVILKTKYPQGGEKQLLKAVLKREVPPGKLPLDVGSVVQNVGTCFAVYEAIYLGKPLIERCVTLTGDSLKDPGNFIVKIGTTLKDAVDYCGGFTKEPAKIIAGGPMMGISQYSIDQPIIKGITGVLFLSKKEAEVFEETACVRCAKCVDVCPVNLLPTDIMRMVKYERWHYLNELFSSDCMECGACAYICPSRIPLVQYIKLAKIKEMGKK